MPKKAPTGPPDKPGTDLAAELRELAWSLEAVARSARALADRPNVVAEQAREAERLRAMLRCSRDLADDDSVAPRMLYVEGVSFYATCERMEATNRATTQRDPLSVEQVDQTRAHRARLLIDRLAHLYPEIARRMDPERVAAAIKATAEKPPPKKGCWQAIRSAWPGSIQAHPDERGWSAEWSRWKRTRGWTRTHDRVLA